MGNIPPALEHRGTVTECRQLPVLLLTILIALVVETVRCVSVCFRSEVTFDLHTHEDIY